MVLCIIIAVASMLAWGILRKQEGRETVSKAMLTLCAAAVLGILAEAAQSTEPILSADNRIERGEKGEADYETTLTFSVEETGETYDFSLTVPARTYTTEEEEALLEDAWQDILSEFAGESKTTDIVTDAVCVRSSYEDGAVDAEWIFADSTLVDDSGQIIEEDIPEEGILTQAWVDLYCGSSTRSEEILFCIMPKDLSEKERIFLGINRFLNRQKAEDTAQLTLPDAVEGYTLAWSEKKSHVSLQILLLGAVVAAFLPFLVKSREREAQKARQQKLMLEYPDFVSKLTLLLAAGMTVQSAWKRIAATYEQKKKQHKTPEMPVYEEMLITCREMENGVGEERVYDRFGDRCGHVRYRRLGNLLTQNLKKGSRGLVPLLEREVEEAFEERKSTARRYGEEASTKLLGPMMLMLGIVLIILLYPAVVSFQL